HRMYRVTGPIDTKKFRSKGHGMIVEIRSTGTQTLFPPSVHPCGEDCRWEDAAGVPTEIDPATLYRAVEQLADAVLEEFGEKRQTANTSGEGANKQSDPLPKRRQACLDAMARMQVVDENDGSHRLFAAACR